MQDNLELVQHYLDAYNQDDVESLLALTHADFELETPGGGDHGLEAARSFYEQDLRQEHAESRVLVERMFTAGDDRVLVLYVRQMRWRQTGEVGGDAPLAAVFTLRDGKVVRLHVFSDRQAALQAAGL
jgi:ketosteroid isomerase-like protein